MLVTTETRLIAAIESIAESMKTIAEKPVPGITLELSDGFNKASENLRDLVLADETRNAKIPTFCRKCKTSITADEGEVEPLCDDCKGAAL